MARRTFTPEEANALLPRVRPLAERLVDRRRAQRRAEARHAELAGHVAGNGGDLSPGELGEAAEAAEAAGAALAAAIAELTALGVLVKDLDRGLVDFPAFVAGEEALLCWQLGEEEVAFWHRPEDGFAGRRPL